MPRRGLPNRWLAYEPVNKVIAGTCIVPFKTPLKPAVMKNYNAEISWTPVDVMASIPNLGLVINLTYAKNPYYDPHMFEEKGVWYEHIPCAGQIVPSPTVIEDFTSIVDGFKCSSQSHGKVIGVHCTHGVNRTGHVICSYMVDSLHYSPDVALQEFHNARGYPVERQEYIDALHRMYNC